MEFNCPYCFRAEFVCSHCGAKFPTREGLRSHIIESHLDQFDAYVNEFGQRTFISRLTDENVDNCYEALSQQIYIDNDYMNALKIADKYLYAWLTRDGSMAYDLLSDNLKKKYKGREDFKVQFAGLSNPHHESFEIAGCKCRSKDRIRFKVWVYYHYTGVIVSPYNRTGNNACIELFKIDEETWLVDKVLGEL